MIEWNRSISMIRCWLSDAEVFFQKAGGNYDM